ncbi:conserved hypothetical protein [Methylocella tundrae]|uniref:DUF302 domain-containing protein n=1 Tax=Methylocella tundrae TaxID=227605 RepID=A0A8B6M3T9_METTU|nr:DUF302 domain-containing protein [Methylocella tundrae]VTZ26244.1 conserved hypothetical protein [Methylocella tundrae]VTZ49079.1 conserved hypothetical protein [Methylocella tundrae]
MQDQSTLIHLEYLSGRTFDEVVTAFEDATGVVTNDQFRDAVAASAGNADDFIKRMHAFEGPSGFMRFLDIDHSAWMKALAIRGRARLYILGNPLIAATMVRYDLGAALNVPVRALILEDPATDRTRLIYDLPSSLMERLRNDDVHAAALKLDEKLAALAELATGAQP